jgi:hypothetical protein
MSSSFSEKRPVLVVAAIGLLIAGGVVLCLARLPLQVRLVVCVVNVIAASVLAVAVRQLPKR